MVEIILWALKSDFEKDEKIKERGRKKSWNHK